MPLFVALWYAKRPRRGLAIAGIGASTVIIFTSNSSTPVTAFLAAILGLALWPLQSWMRAFRWALVLTLTFLHMVMKAPVWHLISRVDISGGSSSYHRYQLIDQLIRHFKDWWMLGTKSNADWGWDMWDLANQYVATGEKSGLVPFILLITIIVLGFKGLGRARQVAAQTESRTWLRFVWSIGTALFAQVVAFFGISYFDQMIVVWYVLLAAIAAVIAVRPRDAKSPKPGGGCGRGDAGSLRPVTMELSIICVNWNSTGYLTECIRSIYEWTRRISLKIIVVDNASPAGDVNTLKEIFPEIVLIKSARNLGFAGANNLGAQRAAGQHLLFLNPDTKLMSPAIEVMLEQSQPLENAGIIGCKLLNADSTVQTSSVMKFPRILNALVQVEWLRLRWPRLWGIGPLFANTGPVPVEAISGACMLIDRDVFKSVGMFSTDYFMYAEDVDLCLKLARAGYRNYYIGQASIVHYGGKSSSPGWQTVMKTKAELQFFEKSYGRFYALMFRLTTACAACARLALIACARIATRESGARARIDSAWGRWVGILRTLLTEWGPEKRTI